MMIDKCRGLRIYVALAVGVDENGKEHRTMHRLLTQLLAELDGFAERPGNLLFLDATNLRSPSR